MYPTLTEAIHIANRKLARLYPGEGPHKIVVDTAEIMEQRRFWIMPFDAQGCIDAHRRACETEEGVPMAAEDLGGWLNPPRPLCVYKYSGICRKITWWTRWKLYNDKLEHYKTP